jgi:hypothetical protein
MLTLLPGLQQPTAWREHFQSSAHLPTNTLNFISRTTHERPIVNHGELRLRKLRGISIDSKLLKIKSNRRTNINCRLYYNVAKNSSHS